MSITCKDSFIGLAEDEWSVLNKIAQLMMGIGAAGLVLSFSTLLRGREGSLVFLIAGAALLAVGAPLYYASVPTRRDSSPAERVGDSPTADEAPSPAHSIPKKERVWPEQKMPTPREERFRRVLAYIVVAVLLIGCIAATVWVVLTGADPAILFLVWIALGGFGIFVAAQQISLRNK